MFFLKPVLLSGLVSLFVATFTFAQDARHVKDQGAEALVIQVLQLNHSTADSIEEAIHGLGFNVSIAYTEGNQILLRGQSTKVNEVMELIRTHLDIPSSRAAPTQAVTEFIPLGLTPTHTLMPALQAVVTGRRSQIAIDQANRMLVVKANPSEITAVRSLLAQLNKPARSLMLNFFFIRAQIGESEKRASTLPNMLRPIAQTLSENGFGHLSLMAPVTLMVDEGLRFESESNLQVSGADNVTEESIAFHIEGEANIQANEGIVQLAIEAQAVGEYGRDDQEGSTHFEVMTTIATKLDSFVILAASPSSTANGNAIALVVRTTLADATSRR